MRNYLQTTVPLAALTVQFLTIGTALGDAQGMWLALALAFAFVVNGCAYLEGPRLLLITHRAVEIDRSANPELDYLVSELARVAGIPAPRIYISKTPQPNAFALGRGHSDSVIVLTEPLLKLLTKNEIAAVVSHELAHIKSYDTAVMTISASLVGAIAGLIAPLLLIGLLIGGRKWLSFILIAVIVLLAAVLFQLVHCRSREYAADKLGSAICGHPEWLASALRKLDTSTHGVGNIIALRNIALAPLHIVDPLPQFKWNCLFATHPPIERRLARLR